MPNLGQSGNSESYYSSLYLLNQATPSLKKGAEVTSFIIGTRIYFQRSCAIIIGNSRGEQGCRRREVKVIADWNRLYSLSNG